MKYFLNILIFLMISCQTGEKTTFSSLYVKNYNSNIRWKRFENLKPLIEKDNDILYLSIKDRYKDITIEDFKIISMKKIKKNRYKVLVERNEIILPSTTLKINRYYEYWHFDAKNKRWYLKDEVKMEL